MTRISRRGVDSTCGLSVMLNGGTEPAFSSPLNDIKQSGDFVCARKGCDGVLFRTDTKYDSGTGWPSFWDPVDDNVKLEKGNFLSFMFGTECKCASATATSATGLTTVPS